MSILIKGMDMPEHCDECKLKVEYEDETFCPFFTDNVEYWIAAGRRHEDCPLDPAQSHEKHGYWRESMTAMRMDSQCMTCGIVQNVTTTLRMIVIQNTNTAQIVEQKWMRKTMTNKTLATSKGWMLMLKKRIVKKSTIFAIMTICLAVIMVSAVVNIILAILQLM